MNKEQILQEIQSKKDLLKSLQAEKLVSAKQIELYEQKNKILYFGDAKKGYLGEHGSWTPNPPQKELISAWSNPLYKIFTLTGGNRFGKTFSGTMLILSVLDGKFPWEPEERRGWLWQRMGWKQPIKIRWVGQDWEKHVKTVLVPSIKGLWPESWIKEVKKNNVGVEAHWTLVKTGATLEIMSNKSESDLFEGWNGNLIVYDEPPRRDNRVACARGLIDSNGREVFCMTLLKEAWVDREVIKALDENGYPDDTVYNIHADIYANVGHGITIEGIKQFSKVLTEDEKDARLRGIPSYKSGLVLKIDRKKHVVERFDIPAHYLVDVAIDIGVAKPHDVTFIATAPMGFKYVIFGYTIKGDGEAIADSIIKKKQKYNLRINRVIIDPLAKADKNNENSTYEKVDMHLNRFGHYLECGAKQKDDGIIAINSLLKTVNGEAALFFFKDCIRAVTQAEDWMYEQKGEHIGKPSKVNDDQCENLYRLMLLGTEYYEPYDREEEEDNTDRERNKFTGY